MTSAFAPITPMQKSVVQAPQQQQQQHQTRSSTSLSMGRTWNFNEGRGPFGLKKNAEIWNGRVAQMGFTVVLLQELFTGKGVIQGFQDGDFVSFAMLGLTAVSVLGLSAFLTIKGSESVVDVELKRE